MIFFIEVLQDQRMSQKNSVYFLGNIFDSNSFSFVKQTEEAKNIQGKGVQSIQVNGITIRKPILRALWHESTAISYPGIPHPPKIKGALIMDSPLLSAASL